ncbi:hypothetical protein M3226_28830 [Neobacillus cucumis]|uniref:hypothetical protein n=1 Tax=Neobacillus cucumis TaxID=1740721 RepID=UPI00203F3387|nr:hypothetical protein [Neobacillus cucumis]MCM3729590.1 hypothetical protein [Neobacillus cucumis]
MSEDKGLDIVGIGKSLEIMNQIIKNIQEAKSKKEEKIDGQQREKLEILRNELKDLGAKFDDCFKLSNDERNDCIQHNLVICGELLSGAMVHERAIGKNKLKGETWEAFLFEWKDRFPLIAKYDNKIFNELVGISKLYIKREMVRALEKFEELFFVYIPTK